MSISNAHSNSNFNVIVIGAGLGGLSLAQSLRRTGIHVQIFERDHGPFDRPQGYRLHLDADAINACKEVLSPELNALFEATAQWTRAVHDHPQKRPVGREAPPDRRRSRRCLARS